MKIEKLKLYLPKEYKSDIYSVDFQNLYQKGYNTLFFDLDNTLADYDTLYPSEEIRNLFSSLKDMGFNITILSNNSGKRVKRFKDALMVNAYHSLLKPFLFRLKKHLTLDNLDTDKIVWIGDQLVTDIRIANALNIYSILLKPISRASEKWYTRLLNRKIERNKLKKIKKYLYNEYISLGFDLL